jgi:hypothetical protein
VGLWLLRPLTGLLYQPRVIGDGDCGEIGGMKIGTGNRSTRRKPASAPLCPPQILPDFYVFSADSFEIRTYRPINFSDLMKHVDEPAIYFQISLCAILVRHNINSCEVYNATEQLPYTLLSEFCKEVTELTPRRRFLQ